MASGYDQSAWPPSATAPSHAKNSIVNTISNIMNIAIGPLVLLLTMFSVVLAYLQWRHQRSPRTQAGNTEAHEAHATPTCGPVGTLRSLLRADKRQTANTLRYAVVESIDRNTLTLGLPASNARDDAREEAEEAARVE